MHLFQLVALLVIGHLDILNVLIHVGQGKIAYHAEVLSLEWLLLLRRFSFLLALLKTPVGFELEELVGLRLLLLLALLFTD